MLKQEIIKPHNSNVNADRIYALNVVMFFMENNHVNHKWIVNLKNGLFLIMLDIVQNVKLELKKTKDVTI